jgi:hypothetical protein
MEINIVKLYYELEAAGLPVCSVRRGEPIADYTRDLTVAEKKTEKQVVAAHDPTPMPEITPEEKLLNAMQAAGVITAAQVTATKAVLEVK